ITHHFDSGPTKERNKVKEFEKNNLLMPNVNDMNNGRGNNNNTLMNEETRAQAMLSQLQDNLEC
ncbi:9924_t:CDS:2, partial [Cetraspora pellucida]